MSSRVICPVRSAVGLLSAHLATMFSSMRGDPLVPMEAAADTILRLIRALA